MVQNLFYQIRVKLRAEDVGLTGVSWESGQILLKYPAPAEGAEPKRLPDLPNGVRGGKGQYWVTLTKEEVWTAKLLDVLVQLGDGR
jgi:transcription-repair coupling factor (superfamily II helicase)